jgi:pimeloyl-ACP methyl ester carboxylesterase
MHRPFKRGRWADLPAHPTRPHAYAATRGHTLRLDSTPFGTLDVHWREHGQGPPLLLVHGLMTSSYSWRYVVEELGRDHRLIIPDLPGAGRSDAPDVPYSGAALATFIGEFVEALGLRGCLCIGNSLGGYLCMRAAQQDPGLFPRLVNLHSPGVPEPRIRLLNALLSLPGVGRGLAWFVRQRPHRWAWRNVHYWDEGLKSLEEAAAYGDPLSTVAGSRAFVRYLADAVSARDFAGFLATLAATPFPIPLLLVYARQDPMVPPWIGDALAAATPAANLTWLEDSSHFAHVDSPERFVAAVRPFLAG